MKKLSFYASHALAIFVFAAFYLFMLWAGIDTANHAALHPSFWLNLTVIGLLTVTALALIPALMAGYTLFVRGYSAPAAKTAGKGDFVLPQAEATKS